MPAKGQFHTEESKHKMSVARKLSDVRRGKCHLSDQTKRKMSMARKGRVPKEALAALTPEVIARRTESIRASWTDEKRKKVGIESRQRWATNQNMKAVIDGLNRGRLKSHSPESNARRAESVKASWTPERRKAMAENPNALRGGLKGLQKVFRNRQPALEKAVASCFRKANIQFAYQKIFPPHIVDFFLPTHNLVVECDEPYHNTSKQQQQDLVRMRRLVAKYNIRVTRVKTVKDAELLVCRLMT